MHCMVRIHSAALLLKAAPDLLNCEVCGRAYLNRRQPGRQPQSCIIPCTPQACVRLLLTLVQCSVEQSSVDQ